MEKSEIWRLNLHMPRSLQRPVRVAASQASKSIKNWMIDAVIEKLERENATSD